MTVTLCSAWCCNFAVIAQLSALVAFFCWHFWPVAVLTDYSTAAPWSGLSGCGAFACSFAWGGDAPMAFRHAGAVVSC